MKEFVVHTTTNSAYHYYMVFLLHLLYFDEFAPIGCAFPGNRVLSGIKRKTSVFIYLYSGRLFEIEELKKDC